MPLLQSVGLSRCHGNGSYLCVSTFKALPHNGIDPNRMRHVPERPAAASPHAILIVRAHEPEAMLLVAQGRVLRLILRPARSSGSPPSGTGCWVP
jgi:hypothetical protein